MFNWFWNRFGSKLVNKSKETTHALEILLSVQYRIWNELWYVVDRFSKALISEVYEKLEWYVCVYKIHIYRPIQILISPIVPLHICIHMYIYIYICILSANTNSDFSYNSRVIWIHMYIYYVFSLRIQIMISRIIPGTYMYTCIYIYMYCSG